MPVPNVVFVMVTVLAATPVLLIFTFSKFANVTDAGIVRAAVASETARFKVSEPKPPLILSKELSVPALAATTVPLITSLPEDPTIVSTLVVSGLVSVHH